MSAPKTRAEFLQYCRALEAQLSASFSRRAEQLAEESPDHAEYLLQWSERVTVTDLKEVPDELLQLMPAFPQDELLMAPFTHTTLLEKTECLSPLAQPHTGFRPQTHSDLYNLLEDVENRAEAEDKMLDYFSQLWAFHDELPVSRIRQAQTTGSIAS